LDEPPLTQAGGSSFQYGADDEKIFLFSTIRAFGCLSLLAQINRQRR